MDPYPCGWAKGYEDGGRLVNQRHYPVMFFDGRRFHKECGVGWVPLSSLETFHPDNTNIVHRRSVAKFLVDGDPRLASSSRAVSGKCIVTPDEHDCNDAEIKSSVRQADPYLGLVGDKPIEDNSVQRHSQMEHNARTAEEKCNKDPEVNYNSVVLEDFKLRPGAGPGSQTHSRTQEILD
ncbi:uncharacterized protein FTOL_07443 [Fusarium torulosum]|uniref:Uncharacterized protein n=1 Tax=Fusarium torulosum TaxID=33205 RepID=A0AAE8MBE9_9HYPO|nr:uncharacterized protein FTOL_07443 [Fusarium torulosum]